MVVCMYEILLNFNSIKESLGWIFRRLCEHKLEYIHESNIVMLLASNARHSSPGHNLALQLLS